MENADGRERSESEELLREAARTEALAGEARGAAHSRVEVEVRLRAVASALRVAAAVLAAHERAVRDAGSVLGEVLGCAGTVAGRSRVAFDVGSAVWVRVEACAAKLRALGEGRVREPRRVSVVRDDRRAALWWRVG